VVPPRPLPWPLPPLLPHAQTPDECQCSNINANANANVDVCAIALVVSFQVKGLKARLLAARKCAQPAAPPAVPEHSSAAFFPLQPGM
jgi:hypothetical protein